MGNPNRGRRELAKRVDQVTDGGFWSVLTNGFPCSSSAMTSPSCFAFAIVGYRKRRKWMTTCEGLTHREVPFDALVSRGNERVERVIGRIRRECLNHLIVFDQGSRYRSLKSVLAYYDESGRNLSLANVAPGHSSRRRRRRPNPNTRVCSSWDSAAHVASGR